MNKEQIFAIGYISLFLLSIICLPMIIEAYYINQFNDKNLSISKNIASNIVSIENQMNKTLHNAAMHFENYLMVNPHPTRQQLIDLSNKLEMSGLGFFGMDGKLEGASTDALENPKLKNFFKTYSMTAKDPEWYEEIKKHDVYIYFGPIVSDMVRPGLPWKGILRWNKKLGKFLNPKIWGDSLKDILVSNIKLHKELLSIKVFSPSGKVILEDQKQDSISIPLPVIKEYSEEPVIINTNHAIYIYFSFGGIKHSSFAKSVGLTNDNSHKYFYNIMLEFSRKNINNQILMMKLAVAAIIFLAFGIIYLLRNNLEQKQLQKLSLLKQAYQIHHDVSSPLLSLDWGISAMARQRSVMEGEQAIQLKQSVDAVKDIINDLHYLHDDSIQTDLKLSTELIYPIIYSAFSSSRLLLSNEKKINHLTFEPTKDWNLLVNINLAALRRVLINLIKNAIESGGKTMISLKRQDNYAVITISDTGKGIEANILEQLMSGKSVTHGKVAGKGLGFPYTKRTIEQLGGAIALESKVDKGTKQIIKFPISTNKPSWFIDRINLENIKTIVIVDDFSGIHEIWKEKLKNKDIKLVHLHKSEEFISFIAKNKNADNILYLVDFALEDVFNNGLSLIRKNDLQSKSVLVTSKYLEQFVKNESIKHKVRILPKEFIAFDIFG